jgi:NitT/TauT family transport system substrate-binding protein
MRKTVIFAFSLLAAACAVATGASAADSTLTPVTFTLNWIPSADHAGYYAAKLMHIYERYGLDVTITPGGPQLNIYQLLAAGQTDMIMGTTMRTLNARLHGIPIVTIASWYQKDATTFMLHPENKSQSLAELNHNPMFIPGISRVNYWPWLKAKFGYSDEQLKPFDSSYRAWSLDPTAVAQGYVTNDHPIMVGVNVPDGRSLMLADFGWTQYINTVDATDALISEKPEVLRNFLKATAEGWRSYLADPKATNEELIRLNSQLDMPTLVEGYKMIKDNKLLDGGDAAAGKIGVISDKRMSAFVDEMVTAGAIARSPEYAKSYTLKFLDAL